MFGNTCSRITFGSKMDHSREAGPLAEHRRSSSASEQHLKFNNGTVYSADQVWQLLIDFFSSSNLACHDQLIKSAVI